MDYQHRMKVRAARVVKPWHGVRLNIGRWPAGVVVLNYGFDQAAGKLKELSIGDLLFDDDGLDDNVAQIQRRFPRGLPVISTPGARRVSAYFLTTTLPAMNVEVEIRRQYRRRDCRGAAFGRGGRPPAKPIYQARARVVMTYKFKVDREIKKYTQDNRWVFDKIEKDPRGMRSARHEGGWTFYGVLEGALKEAKCIVPRTGVKYTWHGVGRNHTKKLFPFDEQT